MVDISSINNQQVKDWKKLHTRKERKKTKTYLIEGFHLVEEALKFKKEAIQHIIVREDVVTNKEYLQLDLNDVKISIVTQQVADELSETETSQGIFAIVGIGASDLISRIEAPFLLLDAVQDPGNVGTMIRTADAAGFQGVILGAGTVDLYNAKTLRSAQGSHFHLEIYEGDLGYYISQMKDLGLNVYGTALNEAAESYKNVEVTGPFGLVVGNEGSGMSDHVLSIVDQNIYIPMKGKAESLNVAIAASIMMFHLN